MDQTRLDGILHFVQASEALKDTLRSGLTSEGRQESTAEHSWRLCLLVMLFEKELEGVDLLRLLKLCLVHDLGEAISGDIPAIHQDGRDKSAQERADLIELAEPLPEDMRADLLALWDEYNDAKTLEAVLAKGFDKIETMLQHLIGRNAPDFDYRFNLDYGAAQTARHPLLRQIRDVVDHETRRRVAD